MRLIELHAKTREGKNKLQQHGRFWFILEYRESVPVLNNESGMLLRSQSTNDMRWIKTTNDDNFSIVWS